MRSASWQKAVEEGRPWTMEEAKRALAACDASGIATSDFARQYGGRPSRFYWWRKRLAEDASRGDAARLLPVRVVESGAKFVPREARVVLSDGRLRVEMEGMSP